MSLVTSHAIKDIVDKLTVGSQAICNESALPSSFSTTETANMSKNIRELMVDMYSNQMPEAFKNILKEDAENASKIFGNSIAEQQRMNLLESATNVDVKSLVVSIATTMRAPYEANLHRLAHTEVTDKWTFAIQNIEPTIKAPGHKEESLIDALSPFAKTPFIDKTELNIETLTNGLVPGIDCNNLPLTAGLNPLIKINRDCRIIGIEAKYLDGGVPGEDVPQGKIKAHRGATPYFNATTEKLTIDYDVILPDGTSTTITINSSIDFSRNLMRYLDVVQNEHVKVTKVYFYATASHEEHLAPITTGVKNSFTEYMIPTRPHIEISLPKETQTDVSNSVSYFNNNDIMSYMTSQAVIISTRMEEERIAKQLKNDRIWEAKFPFEASNYFSLGNTEWFKREFIPFLDHIAMKMMTTYNISDCHFRVAVSPFIMKLIDCDYSIEKNADESSGGSGMISYSMGIKTSTAKFYFISTLRVSDSEAIIVLQPNEFKEAQLRTLAYFKYSSFVTDKLRRADNPVFEALTYCERNMPLTFTPAFTHLTVSDMYINNQSGSIYMRKVSDAGDESTIDIDKH